MVWEWLRDQRGEICFVNLCFQLRSLDAHRFPATPAGKVTGRVLEQIEDAVRYCLGLYRDFRLIEKEPESIVTSIPHSWARMKIGYT